MQRKIDPGFFRRMWSKKWIRRSLYISYFVIWTTTGLLKIFSDFDSTESNIPTGLSAAVMRAVFMREDEYKTIPTENKWIHLVHKEEQDRAFPYFCKVRPNGELYAFLPDGQEAPAMIGNCKLISAHSREEISSLRQWFKDNLYPLEFVFYFVFQSFIWDTRYVHYVDIPEDYKANNELYKIIIDALSHPCFYICQAKNLPWNGYDLPAYLLCKQHVPIVLKIHIIKQNIPINIIDTANLETFNLTSQP